MSISPFPVRPGSPAGESRRARLVLVIATVGIAATLLAYAASPGVRHAVGHAAHSFKHAVSHVFDQDKRHAGARRPATPAQTRSNSAPSRAGQLTGR